MRYGRIQQDRRALVGAVAVPFFVALAVLTQPFNHDNAWLLEATRRWMGGATLYRDIVEINPPLIFFENVLLTAGMLTEGAYIAGVAVAITISAAWVNRWHGAKLALLVSVALSLSGFGNFGQRDHLALIFLTPFLFAPQRLKSGEASAVGAWAFLGVGLKPYFALIPLAYVIANCIEARSLRPTTAPLQNWALGLLCLIYALLVPILWPQYVEIIKLGREVYGAFGNPLGPKEAAISVLVLSVAALAVAKDKSLAPLAAAMVGGLASFFLQGRFWFYHLIPAIGLAAILASMAALRSRGAAKSGLWVGAAGLLGSCLFFGPTSYIPNVIPQGVSSVLFLSDSVPVAYPMTTACGVRNTSRFPTFWTLPGAWNRGRMDIVSSEMAKVNEDIRRERPEIIFEQRRLSKFKHPFSFSDWVDLSDYVPMPPVGRFRKWVRRDAADDLLSRPLCQLTV